MKNLIFAALIITVTTSSCGTGRSGLAGAMPRETELPGWSFARPAQNIGGKNIDRIDSAFRTSGAVEYSDVVYRSVGDADREITVQIVKFDTAVNAFGKFSRDRGFLNEGDMVSQYEYIRDNGLYILYGSCYLLIKCNREEESSTLKQMADLIIKNLPPVSPGISLLPDYINVVPGNINNSDLVFYNAKEGPVPDLKNYFARQKKYGKTSRIILFYRTDSKQEAMDTYFSTALKNGKFTVVRTEPYQAAYLKESDSLLMIATYRNWFTGVLNSDTVKGTEAVIQNTVKSINEFEAAAR